MPGGLECPIDHFQAAIALLAEPKMVGIGQIGLKVGFVVSGEGELEDRLELGFDRIDQPLDPLLASSGTRARPQNQGSLSLLEQRPEPRDPSRGELDRPCPGR